MKYYIVKDRRTGFYEVVNETEIKPHCTTIGDPFDDREEAEELMPEIVDEVEYQREQAEDAYYEENRDAIRQQETYEMYRNEY